MKKRGLGRTGILVGEIGMGLEHLLDKEDKTVADTIRAAVDGGVTYLDCHPGHDYEAMGDADIYGGYEKLGRALHGVRNGLCISYIASSMAREPERARLRFEGYLRAVSTDCADVFIIQFCDKMADFEQVIGEGGILEYAKRLRQEGKIRHIGISTHSSAIAYAAIGDGAFDVLMYPVNPAFDVITDEEDYKSDDLGTLWDAAYVFSGADKKGPQPRKSVYAECERRGVGLVAMKPFAGGFIFNVEKESGFTPVNLISYALSQTGVSTVVPGCTNPREIEEILSYNSSGEAARDYSSAVKKSRWSVMENCLYCNHCQPCGAGINIGQVNRLLDAAGDFDAAQGKYHALLPKASACAECGACVERCPFKVDVIGRMKRAAEIFEG